MTNISYIFDAKTFNTSLRPNLAAYVWKNPQPAFLLHDGVSLKLATTTPTDFYLSSSTVVAFYKEENRRYL